MRKYAFILLLLLMAGAALGQKKSSVLLISSQGSTGVKINGKDVIKVYRGLFKQDYSTLTSDSAYFYSADNAVDAFGHVVINQGDTLHIYSDKLNYNGNTKIAILTGNVKMVDRDATLTTNHLTYNTATRIAIYTDGGKLVNKDNTLLSKNGYYFALTRDSYFRYDVSLKTPDALVKTDTMRYNTGTRISYFYGPTNIYSAKNEKDKDTLYTENGNYNTVNEQAAFGKNNLYKSGTKSLKGDSLFYDKIKGYGRAVKHVTFVDKEQKATIKGNLGTYFKADERTLVTEDPYVIFVTEQKDTTKTDSVKKQPAQQKKAVNMADVIKKTIPGKPDTTIINQKGISIKADTAIKLISAIKDTKIKNNPAAKTANAVKTTGASKPDAKAKASDKPTLTVKDTSHIKGDSIYMSADTIETRILTYKDLKIYQEQQRLAHIIDTTKKVKKPVVVEKPSKFLTAMHTGISPDTTFRHRDFFGSPKPAPKKLPKPPTKKQLLVDSLRKKAVTDSLILAKKLEPADTARIRIMIAHHHAKLFKSDLQAKADSIFYSGSDSTMRCYVNPIIWTQGSQLSGDTIYLQMKHKKLDNLTMFPSAFIANVEKGDSTHFNQASGKKMRGFFKDDKLSLMIVTGNAESIYFSRDSGKTTISGMERSLSNRITIHLKDNTVTDMNFYSKPDHKYGPLKKFKEDEQVLKGLTWKPKERPASKESIIPSFANRNKPATKAPPDKSKTAKQPAKKPDAKPPAKGGKTTTPVKAPELKAAKDSILKTDTLKAPAIKKDSVVKPSVVKKDSVITKPVTDSKGKSNL